MNNAGKDRFGYASVERKKKKEGTKNVTHHPNEELSHTPLQLPTDSAP